MRKKSIQGLKETRNSLFLEADDIESPWSL